MFVLTMKSSKKKLIIIPIAIFIVLLLTIFIFGKSKSNNYAICSIGKYNLSAANNNERLAFLSQFGWEALNEPIEICEIKIPSTFNEVYKNYNSIQQEHGLDLSDYMGKTCERYTYKITNYPNCKGDVYADLLVLNGLVIGGDICSEEMGGFMHGFINPNTEKSENQANPTNKPLYPVESSTEKETLSIDINMPNAPID